MSDPLAQLPPGTDLFTIPLQPPPDGAYSDFNQRSPLLTVTIVICTLMLSFEVVFFASRVWTKFGHDEKWKLDDWFALATVIFTSALAAVLLRIVPEYGRDGWNISVGAILSPWYQKMIVCEGFLVAISLWTGKMCLLTLFYKFFGHITRVRYQIWFVTVLCLPILSMAIVLPVQSAPLPGRPWGTLLDSRNSDSNVRFALAVGVVILVVDLMILYIPIPVIATLNLSRRRKVGVLAIFLTGLIAIVADIIGLYYRVELYRETASIRAGQIVPLCSFVEACVSVVCSSMPSLAKFSRHHLLSSHLFVKIRSRFTSDSSKDLPFHEIQEPKKSDPKRKKGPYSIPTTHDFSAVQNTQAGDVELLDNAKGWQKPTSSIDTSSTSHEVGTEYLPRDIQPDQRP